MLGPAAAGADLLSPGPLTRAHQSLEGIRNCTKCHEAGEQLSDQKCLSCHDEVGRRMNRGEGLHGRIPAGQRACASCHKEHHGKDFEIVDWGGAGKQGFNHDRTGWALGGAHKKAKCGDCHDRRLVVDADIKKWLAANPKGETYLGLPTGCASCHFDEHRGQLGDKCIDCHDTGAWKPARGFDHGKTDFALRGKHRAVACKKCHEEQKDTATPASAFPAPKDHTFLHFEDLPHASCTDCHKDPHGGRFGQRCTSCHSEAGWFVLHGRAKSPAFHEKTRFPLRGEHAAVPCKSCHGPFPGQKAKFRGLAFERCSDCHADAHLGQLAPKDGKAQGCDACHGLDGFVPATFEATDHDRTGYPLEGAHRAVACSECHANDPKLAKRVPPKLARDLKRKKRPLLISTVVFDLPRAKDGCVACHQNPHGKQFAERIRKDGCESCHASAESFAKVRFDHDRETRFPLDGAHREAACGSCHVAEKNGRPVQYAGVAMECAACHEDVHAGQLAAADGKTDCATCHGTDAFTPTPRFRHEPPMASFRLDGKHVDVACEACHPEVEVAPGVRTRRYVGLPDTCAGCHADFHKGAFRGFEP